MKGIIELTLPPELQKEIQELRADIAALRAEFQPQQPDVLLTRQEVADLLKCDLSSVWAWSKKGKLKSYGIGNRIYYKRSEVLEAVKPINE